MADYDNNRRPEDNRRPEEIEHDLDRTRAQVSSTIDAIQSKLTPGQMMDQAFAYARTSLPADFGANLGNTIRDNPVPVALLGVGIAWLMMSSKNADGGARARRQVYYSRDLTGRSAADYDDAYGSGYASDSQEGSMHRAASAMSEKGHELKDKASETMSSIKDKASELGHRISGSTSSMTDRARDMTHSARERLQGSSSDARARASELTHRSQEQYYRAKDSFSHMLEEQPLVLGVLGVAVGTLLGAALPSTRREDEMMGETRDDLLEKAKQTASTQAEHVKESAKHVTQVAKDEAKGVANATAENIRTRAEQTTSPATPASTGSTTSSTKPDGTPGQQYH